MPNIKIRNYVRALMLHGHTFNIPKEEKARLRFKPYTTPGALERPHLIDKHFIKELKLGYIYRIPDDDSKLAIPFFLKDERDKVRFIPNLSHPKDGVSVNSLISDEDSKVDLPTADGMIRFAHEAKWMGKNDGQSFYRQIPLCKDDWSIVTFIWRGKRFQETRMPWGSRNATKSAQYLSIALAYIAERRVPRPIKLQTPWILNYIDDHAIRAATRLLCAYAHMLYIDTCTRACIQLKTVKTVLFSQQLTLLGIDLNLKNPLDQTFHVGIVSNASNTN